MTPCTEKCRAPVECAVCGPAFEKWLRRYDNPELGPDAKCLSDEAVAIANDAWNAAIVEAERLCLAQYGSSVERYRAACKDCAAQIAKLAEVDR